MELAIALSLAVVGSLLTAFLAAVLWRSLFGDPWTMLARFQLQRRAKQLERFSEAVNGESMPSAKSALERALFLDIPRSESMLEKMQAHHFIVLERVVGIARSRSVRLDNLPVIEDLLHSRGQLLRGLLDTSLSLSTLNSRGKEKGSPTPPWALQEYQRRIQDIHERLATNQRTLLGQLDTLVQRLMERRSERSNDAEVTYH